MPRIYYKSEPGDEPVHAEAGRSFTWLPAGEHWEKRKDQALATYTHKRTGQPVHFLGSKWVKTDKPGKPHYYLDLSDTEWRTIQPHVDIKKLIPEKAFLEGLGSTELERHHAELGALLAAKRAEEAALAAKQRVIEDANTAASEARDAVLDRLPSQKHRYQRKTADVEAG